MLLNGGGGGESQHGYNPPTRSQSAVNLHDPAKQTAEYTMARDPAVRKEIKELEASIPELAGRYLILDKIGEGTFSYVYKAIDLEHDKYDDSWMADVLTVNMVPPQTPSASPGPSQSVSAEKTTDTTEPDPKKLTHHPIVAIKRISVTSSPTRIANELKILALLAKSPRVSHMITAMRDRDQVIVVMQYLLHTDFRTFYSTCNMSVVKQYMRELLAGLEFVHKHGIIHRDIKPTNFLFNLQTGRGAIVDFGLAEFEPEEGTCVCVEGGWAGTQYARLPPQGGIRKGDTRPGKRANRAGTRGFRAPEVLFKCNCQTSKIDIWSAGVILLMFLSRKFTFFYSVDDGDSLVEIASLYGKKAMSETALLHGCVFEASIPTVREGPHTMASIIKWCNPELDYELTADELQATNLLEQLMALDYRYRVSAADSLHHPFLN